MNPARTYLLSIVLFHLCPSGTFSKHSIRFVLIKIIVFNEIHHVRSSLWRSIFSDHPFITGSRAEGHISKEDPSLPREYSIGLADMVGHVKSMFTSLYTQSIRAGIYSTCLYACDQHLKSTSNRRGIRAGPQNKRKKRQAGSQNDDQRRSRRRLLMTALGAHAERPWTARSRLPRKLGTSSLSA